MWIFLFQPEALSVPWKERTVENGWVLDQRWTVDGSKQLTINNCTSNYCHGTTVGLKSRLYGAVLNYPKQDWVAEHSTEGTEHRGSLYLLGSGRCMSHLDRNPSTAISKAHLGFLGMVYRCSTWERTCWCLPTAIIQVRNCSVRSLKKQRNRLNNSFYSWQTTWVTFIEFKSCPSHTAAWNQTDVIILT